jgi:hypothetical protein
MIKQRTNLGLLLAVLLLGLLALAPQSTHASDVAVASRNGNIVENHITSATINPATSIATIGGAIRCSQPTQLIVFTSVTQYRSGKHFAQYYGGTHVLCGTTLTSYTVTATPGYASDRLVPGMAEVGFWAEYCDASGCGNFPTYRDMRLVPGR